MEAVDLPLQLAHHHAVSGEVSAAVGGGALASRHRAAGGADLRGQGVPQRALAIEEHGAGVGKGLAGGVGLEDVDHGEAPQHPGDGWGLGGVVVAEGPTAVDAGGEDG
ncbi:MAG: hypothetical protein LC685_05875 [Actinobacteria bacterium]|nr:hypothetical protein [Actinomycetota bacterium]